jgi:hypothetical protein
MPEQHRSLSSHSAKPLGGLPLVTSESFVFALCPANQPPIEAVESSP